MMDDLTLRRATDEDMGGIFRLLREVFTGEQRIPAELIPLPPEQSPQWWWCALVGGEIAGAVAAWKVEGQTHWGRFATKGSLRGRRIGTRLAAFSFDDLFAGGCGEVYMDARETTVEIVCKMGGRVAGEPLEFYGSSVTPVVLRGVDFFDRRPSGGPQRAIDPALAVRLPGKALTRVRRANASNVTNQYMSGRVEYLPHSLVCQAKRFYKGII